MRFTAIPLLISSLAAAPAAAQTGDGFTAWRADFEAQARGRGYDAALVESLFPATVTVPDSTAVDRSRSQPEFVRPIWEYLDSAVSERRIADGLEKLAANPALFEALEQRYGVERHVLAAVWGLESAYGAIQGDHDVPNALATLGWAGWRPDFVRGELYAVLDMLRDGEARRDQLKGSWAGAMGQTQFIPSSYRRHAQDWNGDGLKDIWSSDADALASTAAYLRAAGWTTGAPSAVEVLLPEGFDWSGAESPRTVREWTLAGVRRADGAPWGAADPDRTARFLAPVGAAGPAFLQLPNFRAIMAYNNSTSYALAVTLLAHRLAGGDDLVGEWPRTEPRMALADIEAIQLLLTQMGYDTQGVDGIIGPNTRAAVRAYQAASNMTQDGAVTAGLLTRLKNEAGVMDD